MKSNEPTMKASQGTGQRSAAHPPAGRVGAPPPTFYAHFSDDQHPSSQGYRSAAIAPSPSINDIGHETT